MSANGIVLVKRKHPGIFAKLSFFRIYLRNNECDFGFQGLHTLRRPLEAHNYTKEFNRKPRRPHGFENAKGFVLFSKQFANQRQFYV